jgi:hypothetical protein
MAGAVRTSTASQTFLSNHLLDPPRMKLAGEGALKCYYGDDGAAKGLPPGPTASGGVNSVIGSGA